MRSLFGVGSAVLFDSSTGDRLFRTNLIKALSLNLTGDLIPRTGGNKRFVLEHFEGLNTAQLQLTCLDWHPLMYQLATGAVNSNIDASANAVVSELESNGANLIIAEKSGETPQYGTFMLRYNGSEWGLFLLSDAKGVISDRESLQVGDDLTLTTTEADIGNGLTAKLGASYTASEGEHVIFQVVSRTGNTVTRTQYKESPLRPSIGGVFVAEEQGDWFTIEIPKMKCSSGLPITLNERVDNEYQLTFDLSLKNDLDYLFQTIQVDR